MKRKKNKRDSGCPTCEDLVGIQNDSVAGLLRMTEGKERMTP